MSGGYQWYNLLRWQSCQVSPTHHPGRYAELRHLLLVAVALGLVAELLREEPDLVIVEALDRDPPLGLVLSHCDVGHAAGEADSHLYVTLGGSVQSPDVVLRVELLVAGHEGGAGDDLVPDLLEGVEEVVGLCAELHPPAPLVLVVRRGAGLGQRSD